MTTGATEKSLHRTVYILHALNDTSNLHCCTTVTFEVKDCLHEEVETSIALLSSVCCIRDNAIIIIIIAKFSL